MSPVVESVGVLFGPTQNSQVGLTISPAPFRMRTRQNTMPGAKSAAGTALVPAIATAPTRIVHARSLQTSTPMQVVAFVTQRNVGRLFVTIQVDSGAISRTVGVSPSVDVQVGSG